MGRRARPAPIAPVSWRDGVHLTGTPIWCDARRRRDVCFVSSAERVPRPGHGQLIGTPLTLALLGAGGEGHLAVPIRKRFTLGTVRLELVPSGHGLGAAALFADVTGRTVLYAGAVRTMSGGADHPADVRACDALVVDAPFGEPHHRFPTLPDAIGRTVAWSRAQLLAQRRPVLFADNIVDALEIATVLARHELACAAGRPIRDAAQRAGTLGTLPAIGAVGKEPRIVIWLDGDHAGLAKAIAGKSFATALISGRAIESYAGYDAGFAWASAADRAQLLAWIESANARVVFVSGPCADAIVAALGTRAKRIGAPHQMALFAP